MPGPSTSAASPEELARGHPAWWQEVARLHLLEGVSCTGIGKRLGRSYCVVRNALDTMEIYRPEKPAPEPLSREERADLVRLIKAGKSYGHAAKWIGCTVRTVAKHAQRAGLENPWQKVRFEEGRTIEVLRGEVLDLRKQNQRLCGLLREANARADRLGRALLTITRERETMAKHCSECGWPENEWWNCDNPGCGYLVDRKVDRPAETRHRRVLVVPAEGAAIGTGRRRAVRSAGRTRKLENAS
jgi:hypothetical protein